jgi:hypothetical protein
MEIRSVHTLPSPERQGGASDVRGKVVRGCPGLKRGSRSSAGTHPPSWADTRGEVARRSQARRNGGFEGRAARMRGGEGEAGRRPPPSVLTTARRPRNEMRRPPTEPRRYAYTSLGAASCWTDRASLVKGSAGSSRSRRQLPGGTCPRSGGGSAGLRRRITQAASAAAAAAAAAAARCSSQDADDDNNTGDPR